MALVTIYEKWSGRKISKRVFFAGVIAFLIVAFFMAWRDVREEANGLRQELVSSRKALGEEKSRNTPNFLGEINEIVNGDPVQGAGSDLFIRMTITNRGAPSIAQGWKLAVKSNTRNSSYMPTSIPDNFSVRNKDGIQMAKFKLSDTIYEKTVRPIERGGMARGWIRFILPDLTRKQISGSKTIITVSFEDVERNKYEATMELKGQHSSKPMYLPGSEQPFKRFQ
jgi:hypothetical protein